MSTLTHSGVKGMHWGQSKAIAKAANTVNGAKAPTNTRNILLGAVGNSKKRYTDPAALKKRTAAGRSFAASLLLSVASATVTTIGKATDNDALSITGNILAKGAGVVSVVSIAQAVDATNTEKAARAR